MPAALQTRRIGGELGRNRVGSRLHALARAGHSAWPRPGLSHLRGGGPSVGSAFLGDTFSMQIWRCVFGSGQVQGGWGKDRLPLSAPHRPVRWGRAPALEGDSGSVSKGADSSTASPSLLGADAPLALVETQKSPRGVCLLCSSHTAARGFLLHPEAGPHPHGLLRSLSAGGPVPLRGPHPPSAMVFTALRRHPVPSHVLGCLAATGSLPPSPPNRGLWSCAVGLAPSVRHSSGCD